MAALIQRYTPEVFTRTSRRFRCDVGRIAILGLLGILAACSGSTLPPSADLSPRLPPDWYESVLVVSDASGGDVGYSWQPAAEWAWALSNLRVDTGFETGRIVLVANRPRDCDQEQIDCHRDCMRRKPPYPHGARRSHGHITYCDNKCLEEYMDCLKLQELKPLSFPAVDRAADWLRRHREEVLVGTIVVAAGVTFVVISAGAGLVVLAPVALLA